MVLYVCKHSHLVSQRDEHIAQFISNNNKVPWIIVTTEFVVDESQSFSSSYLSL